MHVIDLQILIPASPEFIWRILGDLSRVYEWQEDVVSVSFLSTQREGKGARWRQSPEKGRDTIVEISAWYDTVGYQYRYTDGTRLSQNQGRIRLQQAPEGTLVRWYFEYELGGVFAGRYKRSAIAQIQASLRNLHQLVLDEAGGIATHEAKAGVQDAPDVAERSSYQPRHHSDYHDPTLAEISEDEADFATDKQPAYDFALEMEASPAVADTDTKPSPAVLLPPGPAEPTLDDTRPIEVEEFFATPAPPLPDRPEPEALPEPPPEPEPEPEPLLSPRRAAADVSVFEVFGLPKPSKAILESALPPPEIALPEPLPPPANKQEAAPPAEDLEPDLSIESADPAPASAIAGLRRSQRQQATRLRSHR